jgi:hypothetical protein
VGGLGPDDSDSQQCATKWIREGSDASGDCGARGERGRSRSIRVPPSDAVTMLESTMPNAMRWREEMRVDTFDSPRRAYRASWRVLLGLLRHVYALTPWSGLQPTHPLWSALFCSVLVRDESVTGNASVTMGSVTVGTSSHFLRSLLRMTPIRNGRNDGLRYGRRYGLFLLLPVTPLACCIGRAANRRCSN